MSSYAADTGSIHPKVEHLTTRHSLPATEPWEPLKAGAVYVLWLLCSFLQKTQLKFLLLPLPLVPGMKRSIFWFHHIHYDVVVWLPPMGTMHNKISFLVVGSWSTDHNYSLDFWLIHCSIYLTNIYLTVLYIYMCVWINVCTSHAYGSLRRSEEGVRSLALEL